MQAALNDDVIDPSIMEVMNKETQPVVKEMSENSLLFGSRKTGNYILIYISMYYVISPDLVLPSV